MKKIVIACGAGLATSSMVKDKVEAILKQKGIAFQTMQCTLTEVELRWQRGFDYNDHACQKEISFTCTFRQCLFIRCK